MKLAERYIRQLEGYQDPILAKIKEWNPKDIYTCRANANGFRILTEKRQGQYKVTISYTGNLQEANQRILEGISLSALTSLKDCFKSDKMKDQYCMVSVGARKENSAFTEAYYTLEFEKDAPFEAIVSKTVNYYDTMKNRIASGR